MYGRDIEQSGEGAPDLLLEPVSLKLPRFRVRYAIELSRAIRDIGAPVPFIDELADFTGLTSSGEK
jgi:serine protease inhibitor